MRKRIRPRIFRARGMADSGGRISDGYTSGRVRKFVDGLLIWTSPGIGSGRSCRRRSSFFLSLRDSCSVGRDSSGSAQFAWSTFFTHRCSSTASCISRHRSKRASTQAAICGGWARSSWGRGARTGIAITTVMRMPRGLGASGGRPTSAGTSFAASSSLAWRATSGDLGKSEGRCEARFPSELASRSIVLRWYKGERQP